MPASLSRFRRLLVGPARPVRFAAATEGVAAIEFALVLPIMVVFYFGLVGLTVGVMQDRKVTLVSRTVADLAGRAQGAMNNQEIDSIVGASGSVLAPYDPNGTGVIIASVAVVVKGKNSNGEDIIAPTICWSAGRTIKKVGDDYQVENMSNLGEWAKGKPYPGTLPSGFATGNTSFIQTLVNQEYKPVIGAELMRYVTDPPSESVMLNERTPWPVRNVREIPWEGQAPCLPAT